MAHTKRHQIQAALTYCDRIGPQLFIGDKPTIEKFTPATMQDIQVPGKPRGGIWTSTYRNETSAWVEWNIAQGYRCDEPWWLLIPDPAERILIIDSRADLVYAIQQFAPPPNPDFPHLERTDFVPLNFAEIRQAGIVGVHVTAQGFAACRWPDGHTPNLYTWDCESTVFLRWAFVGSPVCVRECQSRDRKRDTT